MTAPFPPSSIPASAYIVQTVTLLVSLGGPTRVASRSGYRGIVTCPASLPVAGPVTKWECEGPGDGCQSRLQSSLARTRPLLEWQHIASENFQTHNIVTITTVL